MHKKVILTIVILFLLYIILGVVLPPLRHRKAGEQGRQSFTSEQPEGERILCLDDNEEALLWRLKVIESAEEELIFSTFDLRDDNSGRDMMAAFLRASDRGVKVKILVDGINAFLYLRNDDHFQALASSPNVEIRFYNPVNLLLPWKLNYRMHDKYLIADDFVYIMGGRNTNDLFLGDYTDSKNIDRDILVYETEEGEDHSLKQLKDYFQSVWELSCCRPFRRGVNEDRLKAAGSLRSHYEEVTAVHYPEAFAQTDWETETMAAGKVTLCTNPVNPGNKEPVLWAVMQQLMEQGEDVIIQTPYVICSRDMYRGLSELSASGTRVQILINAIESGANPFGCIDYVNEKEELLETGAEMYECIADHSLHTKTILVDDRLSAVGSYNYDMRSTYLDTEMMLVIDSPELNRELREQAGELMDQSRHVRPDGTVVQGEDYPDRELSAGKRFFYQILRILIMPFRHLL